jgi:hypothetical protein
MFIKLYMFKKIKLWLKVKNKKINACNKKELKATSFLVLKSLKNYLLIDQYIDRSTNESITSDRHILN